jgi:hypothetical protein
MLHTELAHIVQILNMQKHNSRSLLVYFLQPNFHIRTLLVLTVSCMIAAVRRFLV